jgi:hypothetical protein
MKTHFTRSAKGLIALLSACAILTTAALLDSCNKHGHNCNHHEPGALPNNATNTTPQPTKSSPEQILTSVLTVANITTGIDGSTELTFNENTEYFHVYDAAVLTMLKDAFSQNKPMFVSFNPWIGEIVKVAGPTSEQLSVNNGRETISGGSSARRVDLATIRDESLDNTPEIGVINTTDGNLASAIPDFTTAQQMFDYISHQCCRLPGPYAVDHCIPFQYCIDGCYARAHKMCWILNNRYHYATKKIFSFANAGNDKLCVQGQKWGGCCINWWYHVAPLVTVNTTTGPKAYVFDPAMFDQPVLLSVWLHAQENPSCVPAGKVAHVTMINIQPTSSYAPSGSSGTMFSTDPSYSSTNTTLINYRYLNTCP